jgi:hypothetical protein
VRQVGVPGRPDDDDLGAVLAGGLHGPGDVPDVRLADLGVSRHARGQELTGDLREDVLRHPLRPADLYPAEPPGDELKDGRADGIPRTGTTVIRRAACSLSNPMLTSRIPFR